MPLPILPKPQPKLIVNRLVVTGGRDFDDRRFIYSALNEALELFGFSYLIEGDARGLDKIAGFWARKTLGDAANIKYPADWSNIEAPNAWVKTRPDGTKYNALAGEWRNWEMLQDGKPDYALIFHGGKGTADMFEKIKKCRIPYTALSYDGEYDGIKFGNDLSAVERRRVRNS